MYCSIDITISILIFIGRRKLCVDTINRYLTFAINDIDTDNDRDAYYVYRLTINRNLTKLKTTNIVNDQLFDSTTLNNDYNIIYVYFYSLFIYQRP